MKKLDKSFLFWSFRLLFFYVKNHVNNKTFQKLKGELRLDASGF